MIHAFTCYTLCYRVATNLFAAMSFKWPQIPITKFVTVFYFKFVINLNILKFHFFG